ncbi:MAG: hypothetical protein QOJ33_2655, partial [Chloroflexota bacterium]|nr:hypothetical protein [Chloroflexota bacterium]
TEQALAYFDNYFSRRFGGANHQGAKPATVGDLVTALNVKRATLAQEWMQVEVSTFSKHLADIYQLHFYEPYEVLPQVINYIRSKVGSDVPIDAWETGFSWSSTQGYTPDALANELPTLYTTMFNSGVRYAVYLEAVDLPPTTNEADRPRGLISLSGQYYPGAAAFMTLAQTIDRH